MFCKNSKAVLKARPRLLIPATVNPTPQLGYPDLSHALTIADTLSCFGLTLHPCNLYHARSSDGSSTLHHDAALSRKGLCKLLSSVRYHLLELEMRFGIIRLQEHVMSKSRDLRPHLLALTPPILGRQLSSVPAIRGDEEEVGL
jgi:hypothetical protein